MGTFGWLAIAVVVALFGLTIWAMSVQNRQRAGRPSSGHRRDADSLMREARAAGDATRAHYGNSGGAGF